MYYLWWLAVVIILHYILMWYNIYQFIFSNEKFNYKAFKDYFSEGLRIYYQDKKLLKHKNLKLYN